MPSFTVQTSKGPDIAFNGSLLAMVDSYEDRPASNPKDYYSRLKLYKTSKGFVCVREQCESVSSKVANTAAQACTTLADVHAFFGTGRLSKLLYEHAGKGFAPVEQV
jgi:hypothetical protein